MKQSIAQKQRKSSQVFTPTQTQISAPPPPSTPLAPYHTSPPPLAYEQLHLFEFLCEYLGEPAVELGKERL